MAQSVNKVILIGRLGKDPEVRFVGNGSAVASFSLATSETWNDKQGNRQERTEWHRISVWGKPAEACGQYLKKGSMVYIEGKLQTREYEKDNQKRQVTDVIATSVQFLSQNSEGGQNQRQAPPRQPNPNAARARNISQDLGYPDAGQDDDAPF